jgi:DNA-directed RNA polymerase subunit RPC12/RpoP
MIRFSCPTCGKALELPNLNAGRKVPCPSCGQRLLIPDAPPDPDRNKTLLAAPPPAGGLPPAALSAVPSLAGSDEKQVAARCPRCNGRLNVSERTASAWVDCPHCGHPFVPRPAEEDIPWAQAVPGASRPSRHRTRPRCYGCPYCGTDEPPLTREEVGQTGWILFAVLLLFFFPLCWLPFVCMKERHRVCSECGARLRPDDNR